MIEFTILLDDSELEFELSRSEPELAFVLPPTARIGRSRQKNQDVVHLAPIPVHCFFNGATSVTVHPPMGRGLKVAPGHRPKAQRHGYSASPGE